MKEVFTKKQLREFGLVVGIGLPIIIGFLIPFLLGHNFRIWTLWLACPILFFTIFNPTILFYPYKAWMKIGNTLGWFNSHLILGLVFISVLIPISLVMKIIGYDPLKVKKHKLKSYRENKVNYKVNLKKIF